VHNAHASGASLMDNAEFFAELGKLEATPADDTSEFPEPSPTLGARQRPGMPAREPVAEARPTGPTFIMMPPESNTEPGNVVPMPQPQPAPSPSGMRPAVAMIGFVLMMVVGAGAAALVFHDRVELIVAQWQSASR